MEHFDTTMLEELGTGFRQARRALRLTQQQVAKMAGISRPRYRDIETGAAAARTNTLINVARALGLEVMLVPQAMVAAVTTMLRPGSEDDQPAFLPLPENDQ
ncbi:MAG: helix-turn-helix domain-containing protein [Alphaproteobacteria bacterium]|nr:helix-turn-helix domain-containing protein [Alphaproteobacteria bacterium]